MLDLPDEIILLIVVGVRGGRQYALRALSALASLARQVHNALLRRRGVRNPSKDCDLRVIGDNRHIPDGLSALRLSVAIISVARLSVSLTPSWAGTFNPFNLWRIWSVLSKLDGVEELSLHLPYGSRDDWVSCDKKTTCLQGFNEILRLAGAKDPRRVLTVKIGMFPNDAFFLNATMDPIFFGLPLPLTTLALGGNMFLSFPIFDVICEIIKHSPQKTRVARGCMTRCNRHPRPGSIILHLQQHRSLGTFLDRVRIIKLPTLRTTFISTLGLDVTLALTFRKHEEPASRLLRRSQRTRDLLYELQQHQHPHVRCRTQSGASALSDCARASDARSGVGATYA